MEMIRLILGSIFLLLGISVFVLELIGVYRMKYLMNRMHSAAMGDSLGILLCMIALAIMSGFNYTTLKMLLVVVFLWCTSPVSSHLIARMEIETNEDDKEYEVMELKELEENMKEDE